MKKLGIILSAGAACVYGMVISYKIGKNNGESKVYRETTVELEKLRINFITKFGYDPFDED